MTQPHSKSHSASSSNHRGGHRPPQRGHGPRAEHGGSKSAHPLAGDGRPTPKVAQAEPDAVTGVVPAVGTSFASLALAQPLLSALHDEGYETPTPIQARAIPPIIEGRDILGVAQTGTGKTAAFALPILHRLLFGKPDPTRRGPALPRALILSPTRELATQIGDSFETYGGYAGMTHTVIFGGVSQHHQVRALHRGVDILVATPGRLIDLMEQRITNFSAIEVLVLDEADRMLDMGFIAPIRRIAAALPKSRQTLLFSATMPREVAHLADSLLTDPVRVSVAPVASTAALIEQKAYMVPRTLKGPLLERLLGDAQVTRAVVFTRTKHGADRVARRLNEGGTASVAIHGNKAQGQRQRALDAFKRGRVRVLVATDVAARGLDVEGITHVFNFDIPNEPEAYVHRIGRTGRAGATGIAISFCDSDERGMLRGIERLTGRRLEIVPTPDLPPPAPHAPSAHAGHAHAARPHAPRAHAKPHHADARSGEPRTDDARADRPAHAGGHRGSGASHASTPRREGGPPARKSNADRSHGERPAYGEGRRPGPKRSGPRRAGPKRSGPSRGPGGPGKRGGRGPR